MGGPEITVVIPSYGRPHALAGCLEALAGQTLARHRFAVVVVDDGSPEPVAAAIAGWQERLPLTSIRQTNRGPAAARNRGAAAAASRWLAFTDDDCRPEPAWLETLLAALGRAPGAVVGGRTINSLAADPCAAASQLLVDYLYEDHQRAIDPTPFFTSNNLALPARLFADLGGFDDSFPLAAGEDRDLCDRAVEQGAALVYEPRAVVAHAHAMSLAGFWRQHFAYGRGARLFHHRRAARGRRFPRPRAEFYLGLLSYPWHAPAAAVEPHSRWALATLLALSQLANALGFFRQAAA